MKSSLADNADLRREFCEEFLADSAEEWLKKSKSLKGQSDGEIERWGDRAIKRVKK